LQPAIIPLASVGIPAWLPRHRGTTVAATARRLPPLITPLLSLPASLTPLSATGRGGVRHVAAKSGNGRPTITDENAAASAK